MSAEQPLSTETVHDHGKCCRALRCAHPMCCGYYGEPLDCGNAAYDWCLAPSGIECTNHDEHGDRRVSPSAPSKGGVH